MFVTPLTAQERDEEALPYARPEQSLSMIQVPAGLSAELVASEPFVQDPVALAFDERGRIWVAEMTTYMRDVYAGGETAPIGTIAVLEDRDGDGAIDTRTTFLDDIILPRAVSAVKGGILYADNESLVFAEVIETREGPRAGFREVVDPDYSGSGNVEHKPNGLILGLDNWIHSAKSDDIYRTLPHDASLPKGAREIYRNRYWKMVRRKTLPRGQWGIATDDFGRLYVNTNSELLLTDLIDPSLLLRNPNYRPVRPPLRSLSDSRVFPARETLGVNRALNEGVLNEEGKLTRATSAAGMALYRAKHLPDEQQGRAFVTETVGFLVAAIDIDWASPGPQGKPSYQEAEFLTSTEHRFRPVNAYSAPDGSIYIVDMHRGLVQHRDYMTKYLQDYTRENGLEEPFNTGRIYRVRSIGKYLDVLPDFDNATGGTLVKALSHPNGVIRDMARRLIIEGQSKESVASVQSLAESAEDPSIRINALWTLEGLGALTPPLVAAALNADDPEIVITGLRIIESLAPDDQAVLWASGFADNSLETEHLRVALHLAVALGGAPAEMRNEAMASLLGRWEGKSGGVMEDGVLSGAGENSDAFIEWMKARPSTHEHALRLERRLTDYQRRVTASSDLPSGVTEWEFKSGRDFYEGAAGCAGCHGADGQGIAFLAPKLAGSEWVTGDPERLTALVLHGLQGPVTVDGEVFDAGGVMPGLLENPALGDTNRAAILTYIRNVWGNRAGPISPELVGQVRARTAGRDTPYTVEELVAEFPDAE